MPNNIFTPKTHNYMDPNTAASKQTLRLSWSHSAASTKISQKEIISVSFENLVELNAN